MKENKKCRTCWQRLIRDEGAMERWLEEVLQCQRQAAWEEVDRAGREDGGLVHPEAYRRWVEQGPCVSCPCGLFCNRICSLRARWWDARMERVRRQLGM